MLSSIELLQLEREVNTTLSIVNQKVKRQEDRKFTYQNEIRSTIHLNLKYENIYI